MLSIGALGFASPWILTALLALPAIWWLLRVMPPAPRRVRFPALRFLLGLEKDEETPAHMPPWLLALRLALAALVILGLAGPVWNAARDTGPASAHVVVVDNGWAAAAGWAARMETIRTLIDKAKRNSAMLAIVETAPPGAQEAVFQPARKAEQALAALMPQPFDPDRMRALDQVYKLSERTGDGRKLAITWLSDGLDYGDAESFADLLREFGPLVVHLPLPEPQVLALRPAQIEDGALRAVVIRPSTGKQNPPLEGTVRALGAKGRVLGAGGFVFAEGAAEAPVTLDLPLELRNEISRLVIAGHDSAGAVTLLDDRARRRPVGIVSGSGQATEQPLLAESYYLERALKPFAELRRGTIRELIRSGLSVLVLADVGRIVGDDESAVRTWVEQGGVLLRFAGPRLAKQADDLVPVRLRQGGRALGGSLSWETPQHLAPFEPQSPFAGLDVPRDVTVSRQVLAEPAIDLGDKTWARLEDGTPLVTAARLGEGRLILIHVTANRDWSTLPISGLYVDMLRRITELSKGLAAADFQRAMTVLPPRLVLDGYGALTTPAAIVQPLTVGAELPRPGPRNPPGIYGRDGIERALNLIGSERTLTVMPGLSKGIIIAGYGVARETALKPWLLTVALLLALADGIIVLMLSGRLRLGAGAWPPARGAAVVLAVLTLTFTADADRALAGPKDDARALEATLETRLGYVRTGVAEADRMSRAGLAGLSRVLYERTAVEPASPLAIELERDELVFFPLLYWRVLPEQKQLSPQALAKVDAYLKNGGTILFDTADQQDVVPGVGGGERQTPARRALRAILERLDVPPLVRVPGDHVLTKAFYIIDDKHPEHWFPGRWTGGAVWVEAGGTSESGVRNDGVSSIIIGSHDWAAAWAMDEQGRPVAAVVPGSGRQREYAYRFGVNLVMYTLTGNYKADQVHVPAILERLGQ